MNDRLPTTDHDPALDTDVAECATLTDLAREACAAHAVIEDARKFMRSRIDADAELRTALLNEMIDSALRRAIYGVRGSDKRELKQAIANPCTRGIDAVAGTMGAAEDAVLEWPMPDGRRLGDMLGEELVSLASDARERARGIAAVGSFYAELAKRTGEGRKVRQRVKEKEAAEIWKRVSGAAGQNSHEIQADAARPPRSNHGRNGGAGHHRSDTQTAGARPRSAASAK